MAKQPIYQPSKTIKTIKKPEQKNLKIMIGIPCQDMMHTDFVRCLLQLNRPADSTILFIKGTILPQSRDTIASTAITNNFTHLLFLDSDMNFPPDALNRLLSHDADIVTGLAVSRREPHIPCVYNEVNYTDADFAAGKPHVVSCTDWASKGEYFEVAGCGMAFCLIKVEVLKAIQDRYHQFFNYIKSYGEDLSFCIRATSLGYKIMVDNSFKLGHIGQKTFTIDHVNETSTVQQE